jgi:hypothetical protein
MHRLLQVDIDRRDQCCAANYEQVVNQVVTVEQCCNNMLTIVFIVGCTTLFTPVDINLQQVVDFLNFYACRQGRIQTDATDASASVKIFKRARIVNILLKHI